MLNKGFFFTSIKNCKILICLLFFTYFQHAHATSAFLYQVDLIIFTHSKNNMVTETAFVAPADFSNAIHLLKSSDEEIPYQLLSSQNSNLISEYNKLQKNENFNLLLHYSWLQPSENNKKIIIPNIDNNNWNIQGTVKIKQHTYYALETDLILTNSQLLQFPLQYSKRLKPEVAYYLDHPYAGILIKIHQII